MTKYVLATVVIMNIAVTLIAIVSDNIPLAWLATIAAALFEYLPFVKEYLNMKKKPETSEREKDGKEL